MSSIKGFIVWTWNVIEIYFGGLKEVCSGEKYWDCRQTFFESRADRETYQKEEEILIQKLKAN